MEEMKLVIGLLLVVGLAGPVVAAEGKRADRLQFRLGEQKPGPGLTEMTVTGSKQKVYLHENVELSEADLAQVSVQKTEARVEIMFVLTEAGKTKFAKLTQENIDKSLGIVVEGRLISAPIIKTAIPGGKAVVTGNFSLEEANRIVNTILGKNDTAGGR
jgi:preprotein translocase subunit SecD